MFRCVVCGCISVYEFVYSVVEGCDMSYNVLEVCITVYMCVIVHVCMCVYVYMCV